MEHDFAQLQLIIERFENAQDRLVLQSSDLSLETLSSMVEADGRASAIRARREQPATSSC